MKFLDFHPDQIEEVCKQMSDKDLVAFVLTNKDHFNACASELNLRRFRRFTEMLRNGLPIGQKGTITNKLGAEFTINKSEDHVLKMITPIPRSPDTVGLLITRLGKEIDRYFPTDGLSRVMSIVAESNTAIKTLYIDWSGAMLVFRYSEKVVGEVVKEVEAIGGFADPEDESADIQRHIPISTGRGAAAAPGFAYDVKITIWMVGADRDGLEYRRHLNIKVEYTG